MQLFIAFDIIHGLPADSKPVLWRHEVCEVARKHVCDHVNVCLQPRCKRDVDEMSSVESHVHARAFLYHHMHAKEIVSCLIQACGLQNPNSIGPFRVVVHSRFDDSCTDLFHEAIDIHFDGGECIPPQELTLYCNSGDSVAGFYYDPMVLCQSGRARKRQGRENVLAQVQRNLASADMP